MFTVGGVEKRRVVYRNFYYTYLMIMMISVMIMLIQYALPINGIGSMMGRTAGSDRFCCRWNN